MPEPEPSTATPPRGSATGEDTTLPVEEIRALGELEANATPGPWAWAQTAEKGYGANIGAGCCAEDDADCRTPLAGDLSGREDDWYVDQPIAELWHQAAAPDAAFIVALRNAAPALIGEASAASSLRAESHD
jgi:hypothetical protein